MGICDKYIMVGEEVVPCPDLMQWGEWHEKANRHIGKDERAGIQISTVFLGIDHGFPWDKEQKADYKPVLWETMIFGGPFDQEQWRYNSLESAREGHKTAVRLVELTSNWWYPIWHFYIRPFWYEHIQPYVEMI